MWFNTNVFKKRIIAFIINKTIGKFTKRKTKHSQISFENSLIILKDLELNLESINNIFKQLFRQPEQIQPHTFSVTGGIIDQIRISINWKKLFSESIEININKIIFNLKLIEVNNIYFIPNELFESIKDDIIKSVNENQDNLLGKDKYQNLESEPGIVYITNLIEKIIKNLVVRCNVLDIYFNINQILNKTLNVSVNDITLKTQKSNFDNILIIFILEK